MPQQLDEQAVGADAFDALGDASARASLGPASTDACIFRHVSRASRAVIAAYDPALAPFGLTGHQFNLMMTLGNMGPLTVGALAEVLGMDASGVPRAIRPLADDDLIAVERGADRRQRLLSLTASGRTRLDLATGAWTGVQTELVAMIGANRWLSLMRELRTIHHAAAACSTRRPAPPARKSGAPAKP
jgi:DNA-binding MarR family transcriptional regulator